MNEYEKMLAGEEIDGDAQEVAVGLQQCRKKIQDYNATDITDTALLERRAKEILGKTGEKVNIIPPFYCDYGTHISVGERFFANFCFTVLDEARVTIGSDAFIGPNVHIYTINHHIMPAQRNAKRMKASEVRIGDNVWIGGNTTIIPGVTIGNNCVIGAGSVVTKDIPENSIAMGNPARVTKKINTTE